VGAENPVTSVDLVLRAILSALARLLPGGHLRHLRLTVSPRTFCAGTATWRPGEQPGQAASTAPVGPVQLRLGVLPPPHRDLLAQYQQFSVPRRRRAS